MDGMKLLDRARRAGLTISADQGKLVVRGPRELGPLAEQVLAHKADILPVLCQAGAASREPSATSVDDGPIGAVLIYSHVLEEEVWLVRDADALADIESQGTGHAVFLFDEIEELRGKSVEEIRAIAATKRVFGPGARVLQ